MSGGCDVRLRLPGARTPIVLGLKSPLAQLSARDTLTRWAGQLKIRNVASYTLVVAPTAANPLGEVVSDSAPMPGVIAALRPEDVLELWLAPGVIRVAWWDGSPNVRDARDVLLDLRSPLRHMLPLLQILFGSVIGASDISFHVTVGMELADKRFNKIRPLVSFDSLRNQSVEQRGDGQCVMLSPLTVWEKLSGAAVIQPQREGYLMKQSIAKKKKTQVQRRWFMLKDGHLFYFGARGDSSPKGVLVLEYWALTKPTSPERGIASFRLVRSYEGFASKHGSIYQVTGSDAEIRAWHELLGPRCSNGAGGTKVFGVELRELLARTDGRDTIPPLVQSITAALEPAMDSEGLFRASGSLAHLEYLKDQYDQGLEPPLGDMDVLTVAQLLKGYLRDLPQPLLTADRYDDFLGCVENGVADQSRLVPVLADMPGEHLALLKYLCAFLNRVAQHSARNKMTASNLATCLAPSLLYRKSDTPDEMKEAIKQAPAVASVVEALITSPDIVPSRAAAPSSPRNSSMLSLSSSSLPDMGSVLAPSPSTPPATSGWTAVPVSSSSAAANPNYATARSGLFTSAGAGGWRAGRARPVSPVPGASAAMASLPDPRGASSGTESRAVVTPTDARNSVDYDDSTLDGMRMMLAAEVRARKALETKVATLEQRLASLEARP